MAAIAGNVGVDSRESQRAGGGARRPSPHFDAASAGKMHTWAGGDALLAQRDTRPEEGAGDGAAPFHVVADVRLDARAELAAHLGADSERVSDAGLIAGAYAKWGTDCVTHLTGDFAFALWDAPARRLFCARDQMGIKPFYYRHDSSGLSFATHLASLSRPGDVLDSGRLATFLGGFDDSFDDTAFAAIRRLPPAHWLLWTDDAIRLSRYWTLAPDVVAPNEDFPGGFRQRLFQSIEDRLRGAPQIGALLSGGLDSSSIVSVAASSQRGKSTPTLRTFSFSYPKSPQFDERPYGDAVRQAYGLEGEYVDMEGIAPLDGLADLIDPGDDLFFAPGANKLARVLAQARRSGIGIVLDGHGGDEVASHGFGRLAELARDRRWFSLYRELRGVSSIYGVSPLSMFGQYFFAQGIGLKLRRRLYRPKPTEAGAATALTTVFDSRFASASNFADRSAAWRALHREAGTDETSLHAWNLSSPTAARAFESLGRVADQMGVELRFPFYDRRLVTYALAVPAREKLRDGWTRSVLRRSMQGILPEKVRLRRTKINFGSELSNGLATHHRGLFESLLRDGGPVGDYVDLGAARAMAARLFADPSTVGAGAVFMLWRIAFLGLWLESRNAAHAREPVLS